MAVAVKLDTVPSSTKAFICAAVKPAALVPKAAICEALKLATPLLPKACKSDEPIACTAAVLKAFKAAPDRKVK